jgi:hypothetical protein
VIKHLILIFLLFNTALAYEPVLYYTNHGIISFRSEASQELIKASSSNVRGLFDLTNRTFVFKVLIRTFEGFNSALQQEHFNEKYMESEKFPEAIFQGKIIEDMDFSIDGKYEVRAKGHLTIHGREMERIIRCTINVKNKKINVVSNFNILLSEHNIKVPKVVHEKIASEIKIVVDTDLLPKDSIE